MLGLTQITGNFVKYSVRAVLIPSTRAELKFVLQNFHPVNEKRRLSKFTQLRYPIREIGVPASGKPDQNLSKIMATTGEGSSQTVTVEENDEDEVQFWSRIQLHQKEAAKLSPVEEARTVVERCGRAMLSTISKKYEGFPFGSMVGYAADAQGRPILAISTLSPHTTDLAANPNCSLLVSRDPNTQSESLVAIVGQAVAVPESEVPEAREAYLKKFPDAFWVDFGDFRFVRVEPVTVRLTANIATFAIGASVSEFSGEEYQAASADPISPFEGPISSHMNADHESAIVAMVDHALNVKVPTAKILNVDRFGLRVEVDLKGQLSRIRLPFPRPASDRKDVKDLIVQMTRDAAAANQAKA